MRYFSRANLICGRSEGGESRDFGEGDGVPDGPEAADVAGEPLHPDAARARAMDINASSGMCWAEVKQQICPRIGRLKTKKWQKLYELHPP